MDRVELILLCWIGERGESDKHTQKNYSSLSDQEAAMPQQQVNPLSPLKLVVTVLVAAPLFLVAGYPHPMYVTLMIAFVSIGAGYLAEILYNHVRGSTGPEIAEQSEQAKTEDFLEHLEQRAEQPREGGKDSTAPDK